MSEASVISAVHGLREETREGFKGITNRLDPLNGKVASHEARFQRQDGAEAERAKSRGVFADVNLRDALLIGGIGVSIITGHWREILQALQTVGGKP